MQSRVSEGQLQQARVEVASAIGVELGTTVVRYLRDYPNPRLSQIGTFQSTDYYVNQGNFQISSGYTLRF